MRHKIMRHCAGLWLGWMFLFFVLSPAAARDILKPKMLILSPEAFLKDIPSELKQGTVKELQPKLELIVKPDAVKSPPLVKKSGLTQKTALQKPEKKIQPVLKIALNTPKKLPVSEDKQIAKTKSKEKIKENTGVLAGALPESKLVNKKEALPKSDVVHEIKESKVAAEDVSPESAVSVAETPEVITVASDTTLKAPSTLTLIPAEEKREVQLVVGESKVISAIGLIRTAVGNPAVADVVVVSNHELLVNGKSPGTTTLTLWDKRGRLTYIVTVLKEPLSTKTRIFPLQFLWLKKHEVKTGDGKVSWTITTNSMLMSEIDKSLSLGISKDSFSINTELNNIVVQGTEKDIQKAEMILKGLDVPPQQILIEAKVLEVTDDDAKALGFSWNINKEKVSIQHDTSGGQFKIDTLGELSEQYLAQVNALQETGKANLLANPKIAAVIHRDPGVVFLGDSIPIVTTTKDSTGSSLQSVSYVEVGVNLFFLPTSISSDGYVTMFVHSVSTSVSGFTSAGFPMFKGKSVRSELRIKDGEAVVMGGLLRSDETEVLQKVPYLSDLPFLGNFFKNKKKTKKNSEMIVIFVPHVLKNTETIPASLTAPANQK